MFGHNRGLGLFNQGMGGVPEEQTATPARQLNLVASEGFTGNGMASISNDNHFSVIAHLPPSHTVSPYAPAVYAAYLVDGRGKNGFYAGTLKPAGNGMYQVNFRSPVPLVHYDKVVISLESPQSIMQSPQGPIVMKVKEGFWGGLAPVKKAGGDMWGRVKGFVGSRTGGKADSGKEQSAIPQPPAQPPVQPYAQPYTQPSAQQYPNAAYQPAYTGQAYPQRGNQPMMNRGRYIQPGNNRPGGIYNPGGYPQGGYVPHAQRNMQGSYPQQTQPNYMPGSFQPPQAQPSAAQVNVPATAQMPETQNVQEQNLPLQTSPGENTVGEQ